MPPAWAETFDEKRRSHCRVHERDGSEKGHGRGQGPLGAMGGLIAASAKEETSANLDNFVIASLRWQPEHVSRRVRAMAGEPAVQVSEQSSKGNQMNDGFNSHAGQAVPAHGQHLLLAVALNPARTRQLFHVDLQKVARDAQLNDRTLSLMARIGCSDYLPHAGNPFPRGLPVPHG